MQPAIGVELRRENLISDDTKKVSYRDEAYALK